MGASIQSLLPMFHPPIRVASLRVFIDLDCINSRYVLFLTLKIYIYDVFRYILWLCSCYVGDTFPNCFSLLPAVFLFVVYTCGGLCFHIVFVYWSISSFLCTRYTDDDMLFWLGTTCPFFLWRRPSCTFVCTRALAYIVRACLRLCIWLRLAPLLLFYTSLFLFPQRELPDTDSVSSNFVAFSVNKKHVPTSWEHVLPNAVVVFRLLNRKRVFEDDSEFWSDIW